MLDFGGVFPPLHFDLEQRFYYFAFVNNSKRQLQYFEDFFFVFFRFLEFFKMQNSYFREVKGALYSIEIKY